MVVRGDRTLKNSPIGRVFRTTQCTGKAQIIPHTVDKVDRLVPKLKALRTIDDALRCAKSGGIIIIEVPDRDWKRVRYYENTKPNEY